MSNNFKTQNYCQQDHQVVLKAKYCPRVAAYIMHTEKKL